MSNIAKCIEQPNRYMSYIVSPIEGRLCSKRSALKCIKAVKDLNRNFLLVYIFVRVVLVVNVVIVRLTQSQTIFQKQRSNLFSVSTENISQQKQFSFEIKYNFCC